MKPAEKQHKVLVVDDHPLIRKGLCDAIGETHDLTICDEAGGLHEAIEAMTRRMPDMILLDLNLKDGNGLDFIKRFRAEGGDLPILVVSVYDEEIYAARLLQAGANGYLMKDAPIRQVIEAIRKVLKGDIAVSDAIASRLIRTATSSNGKTGDAAELNRLSDRELQVLELLRREKSNREIADYLGISQKTIGTYKARLMEKLGIRTTPELMSYLRYASVSGKDEPPTGHATNAIDFH